MENIMSRHTISKASFKRAWEKFDLPDKYQQLIYRQWARYYAKKGHYIAEDECLDVALDMDPNDHLSMHYKGLCRRQFADFEEALHYAQMSKERNPDSCAICLEVCRGFANLSRLEDAKLELHENLKKFQGVRRIPFLEQLQVIESNLNDCLGSSWGRFVMKNGKAIENVIGIENELRNKDTRPLWKILHNKRECDVVSELEKEEINLSPIERARRMRMIRVSYQHYFKRNWLDMEFLKMLCTNPELLKSPSMPTLPQFVKTNFDITTKFIKLLHRRRPLYRRNEQFGRNKRLIQKFRDDFLYRVQYQTSRTVRGILKTIRNLREKKDIKKLANYVKDVMSNYVNLKTHRILPWKFELVNEILNELGLAYIDNYLKPNNIGLMRPFDALAKILGLRPIKHILDEIDYVFGDRMTYDIINMNTVQQKM